MFHIVNRYSGKMQGYEREEHDMDITLINSIRDFFGYKTTGSKKVEVDRTDGLIKDKNDLEERVYYKFSKSSQEISKVACEEYYWNYKIGENIDTTKFGFSFVPKSRILLCLKYGDVLNCLTVPDKVSIQHRGGFFDEYASFHVDVKWQKSMQNVDTLKFLISISDNTTINQSIFDPYNRKILHDLSFPETLELWDEIAKVLKSSRTQESYNKIREICK